jgi:DNA-binding transcriptional MocR family regulator
MIVNIQLWVIFTHPIIFDMQLSIEKDKSETVINQIVRQIINLIEDKVLHEGSHMPPTRQLADSLGVNRTTVVKAYEELWALGYFESTPGSYTKVRKRKEIKSFQTQDPESPDRWSSFFGDRASDISTSLNKLRDYSSPIDEGVIDFGRLEPDIRLIESKWMSASIKEQLSDPETGVFGYCHPRGFEPLRRSIVSHMKMHYIFSKDENILITNGSQNSLQLVFQAYIKKDDIVVVERPTYSMVIPLIKFFGAKCIEIPLTPSGLDVDKFEKVIQKNKVKLIYVMPTFQNPTAITMSQEKREKLLSLCEKNNIIIIEDSIEEEMKYFGKTHLPIKSMDTNGIVIYLGTFSKILAPGLRTAWIMADKECIAQLTTLKFNFDISSNTLSQVLLYRYCSSGYYELHIRKLMRAFRKRMLATLKALKTYLPRDYATWIEPLGGFILWLKLEVKSNNFDIVPHFLNFGIRVTDGKSFFYSPSDDTYIRISISKCNELEIEEGIKRMALALKEINI